MAYKSLITQLKNAETIEKLVSGTPAQICCREDFHLHTVSLVIQWERFQRICWYIKIMLSW